MFISLKICETCHFGGIMEHVNDVILRQNFHNDGRANRESGWECIIGLFIIQVINFIIKHYLQLYVLHS